MIRVPTLLVSAALLLAACGVPPNPDEDATGATGVDAAAEPDFPGATAGDPTPASAAAEPLTIAARGFDGVMIGVPLAEVADRLTLEREGAAGELDAYGITDEAGMRTGTVYVDDAGEVTRIVVTNSEAETPDNLGVGSTLAELRDAYGDQLEVGAPSEEDRAAVMAGGLTWHLAVGDASAPGDDAEVVAVVVE